MLSILLYGIFILACVVLIVAVLLQPGKADAGALFTSSVSSTAFGPRGTQTILAKITIIAAAVFMLVALTLSMGIGGPRSVMEGGGRPASAPAPAPAASPDANAPPAASPQQQEGGATAPAPATGTDTNSAGTSASPAPAASPQASPAKKK